MVEKFDLTKDADKEVEATSPFADDVIQHLKGEAGLNKLSFEELDASTKEMAQVIAESMISIAERIKGLPESIRKDFISSIAVMNGPAYEMIRESCKS